MDWLIVFLLSSFGAVMGVLSVRGYTQKLEPLLWLLFALITALVLAKNIDQKAFHHALAIGLLWGMLNAIFQATFFDAYLVNNPPYQEGLNRITFMKPRYFPLVTGPLIGAFTGLILGGLTVLFKKFV